MIKLSFIVPFYGVEPYIGQCLNSLFVQDLPESEYEVICVNDCSPDNSEQIVLGYQKAHSNLVLIRHEVNKRLGAARNTGLSAAKGKYVWFVDSDDFVKGNCIRTIIDCCERNDLQVFHWSIKDNHGKWISKFERSDIVSGIDDLLDGSGDVTYPWNRVYQRRFLLDNNLWFNDLWGGDVIHTICALNKAVRMMTSPECYYYYRTDNVNSDMRSPVTANKVISFCYVLARAIDNSSSELSPRLLSIVARGVLWRVNQSFKPILRLPIKEKKLFFCTMSKDVDLRRYVMSKANSRVRFLLNYPVIVYIIHPFYNFLRLIKNKCRNIKLCQYQ
jgi:glycosyltransferase involved in cell wall biosynthesis